MQFDGDLDSKAREIEDLKKTDEELTRQAAMRWADNQLDRFIPQPPFFLQIVGGIGKGKTTIILNLLREYQKYNVFKRVIYLSPSGLNDAKLRMFLTADNSNYEYTEANLSALMQEIKNDTAAENASMSGARNQATPADGSQGLSPQEIKRRIQVKVPPTLGAKDGLGVSGLAGPKARLKTKEDLAKEARSKVSNRTLIIADDATGSDITKRNSAFTDFLVSIRHQNTSVILCTHSNSSAAAQVRNITTAQILFEPGTGAELKSIAQDIGGISDKTVEAILNHVARTPHGSVLVDRKRPFRDRFIFNFRELLDPDAFIPAKEGGAKSDQIIRSGGFLPTPAQATAAEARFEQKGLLLQHEATRLNTGLTPAEKILQEKNAAAKRKRQVQSGARTHAAKRAEARTSLRQSTKKQQITDHSVAANSAIRSAVFQAQVASNLTQVARGGGVLDAKFQRGVARNAAIATGGRRGIGGRGRRGAGALGPLAQQLSENLETAAQLKREREAVAKDEEARKAAVAQEEKAAQERIPAAPPLPGNPKHLFQLALRNTKRGLNNVAAENRAALAQVNNALIEKEQAEILPDVEPETGVFSPKKLAEDEKKRVAKAKAEAAELEKARKKADAEVTAMNLVETQPDKDSSIPAPIEEAVRPVVKTSADSGSGDTLSKPNSSAQQGPAMNLQGVPEKSKDVQPMNQPSKGSADQPTTGGRRRGLASDAAPLDADNPLIKRRITSAPEVVSSRQSKRPGTIEEAPLDGETPRAKRQFTVAPLSNPESQVPLNS
jgi:ABC-type lipoprotein export system ATPase subunit